MRGKKTSHGDHILLGVVIVLILLGILMVYSASSFRGAETYGDSACFLKQHLIRVSIGMFLLVIAWRIDYHRYRWLTPMMLLLCFVLLVAVLFGPKFQGSRRSLLIFGKQLQPSEFMKLTIIFYLAAVFARGKFRVHHEDTLVSHYLILLLIVGLVFIEPDLGTALVLFFIGYGMFYLAGVSPKRLFKMASFLVPLILLGMIVFPYQRQRITDYWEAVSGSGPVNYQVKQSIIGLAHGGLTGLGYGAGKQKLFFLPEPFSDFILASYGEEFGFVGFFILFLLLMVVLWRGIRIALRAPDRYGYLMAGGITVMILVNALVNAGVVVHLLPTTGLPFPFLSYGGSSLFVHLIGVGILLNISTNGVVPFKKFSTNQGRKVKWLRDENE